MAAPNARIQIRPLHQESDVQLLDDIDSLRSYGINHLVSLPQIVVCGDQSSGKSSVLEAISGIPFPTKDNLCTRFATEVILRRTSVEQVSVTISPGPNRDLTDTARLKVFREELTDLTDIGKVLEKAKTAMDISPCFSAFTEDILRVDISGPDRPHLTIVDLPGLIHSHNNSQSKADVRIVQDLVRRYMTSSRSIILAVVSAKNDIANQIVLKMAQELDPKGLRTLGVITKPDTLSSGSESEKDFLHLAQNKNVAFKLGWHVLKNRSYETRGCTTQRRDEDEMSFLSQGVWCQLPRSTVAIEPFRSRLSRVLLAQIKTEIPALTDEITYQLDERRAELEKLGQNRQTIDEQRLFLLNLAQAYHHIAANAVDGIYDDPFFTGPGSKHTDNRRIRAVIQDLSLKFAEDMRRFGHRYHILETKDETPAEDTIKQTGLKPEYMSRTRYLEHAKGLLKKSRGRELPGTFNPTLVADLFHEQCAPWSEIVRKQLDKVHAVTRAFVESAFLHLIEEDTAEIVLREMVVPQMEQYMNDMSSAAESIVSQYQTGHPITYNHYFTETVHKIRNKRLKLDVQDKIRAELRLREHQPLGPLQHWGLTADRLISVLSDQSEPDMDRSACVEAVDCMSAYYKVTIKTLIDNIATLCIEERLLKHLPHVFTPEKVIKLSSETIARIAKEPKANVSRRSDLSRTIGALEKGLDMCNRHAVLRGAE